MENNSINPLEHTENGSEFTPWKLVLAWVFAALVSTAVSLIGDQYLFQYPYLTIILKASIIAVTQAFVLSNYFKNPWFWALLTFAAYIGTGFILSLVQSGLYSIYSGLSEIGTYIFLIGFEILIQSIIAAVQYIALRKEVEYASRWMIISIFSILLAFISQFLVINLIYRFGSPEVFGSYLRLINLFINTVIAYLITGIGLSYLIQNRIISENLLIDELEE